jgi:hypothetical protein
MVEFYNMKAKRKVDVPEKDIKKQVFEKKGSSGNVQRRYAIVAESDGTKMFKFVSEQTFKSLAVPELK